MLKRIRLAAGVMMLALLGGCGAPATSPTTPEPATSAAVTAAPSPTTQPTTMRISSLKGPTTMGLVKLTSDAEAGATHHDYQVTMYGTPDEIVPQIVQGQVDIVLVPANLASVLYNKTTGAVQVAAINTLGVLYVVENGDTVSSVEDLRDKTVYNTGKGATPEYALNHILAANGIDPATDLTVEYKSEATEVAVLLAGPDPAVAVLPQPYVTTVQRQNPAVRVALSLSDEWDKVSTDSGMVTGVLVVRREFAEANKAAFDEFLADYEASTAWTNENIPEAAELIAGYGIVPDAAIAATAIPASNITFIGGSEMKVKLGGYLQVLFEANPQSVGGALPTDDFYYQQ